MFLAEAALALEETLEVKSALRRLADLVVPELADWCAIDMPGPDGTLELVAVAHRDPGRAREAEELQRRWPEPRGAPHGPGHVLRTGQPELIGQVSDDWLVAAARDEEHLAMLRSLGMRSSICVPLRARGRSAGTLLLVMAESGRRFSREDLDRAVHLGALAGLALDNARLYQEAREERRSSEAARAALVRAHDRASFLAQASAMLETSLDAQRTLSDVAALLVPKLADYCTIDVLTGEGEIRRLAPVAADPRRRLALRELVERYPINPRSAHPIARVMRSGRRELLGDVDDRVLVPIAVDQRHLELMREAVGRTALLLPLRAHGRVVGVLSLRWEEPHHELGEDAIGLLEELAGRIALAADNARIHEQRDLVARTLARSLLPPELPPVPGFEVAARYLPAARDAAVSGDFYDVFELRDGRWAAVIGDVCGKGAQAAALTALARHTLRGASFGQPRPARALETLNESMLQTDQDGRFCTVVYAVLEPRKDGGGRVTMASGGHPAPLLMRADGHVEAVGVMGTMIGVFPTLSLPEVAVELDSGDVLVLFTDGVTEAGTGTDTLGEAGLASTLQACIDRDLEEVAECLVERAIEVQGGEPRDDMALLALRAV
jgi:serine phosphatase RsbU (regulator of sigma subunit)